MSQYGAKEWWEKDDGDWGWDIKADGSNLYPTTSVENQGNIHIILVKF